MHPSKPPGSVGAQAPRVLTRPPFATEAAGVEAIELAATASLQLDPWQALSVRVALAERDDGLWAAREFAELVARQNGKGGVLEAIVLHGMVLVRDPLTLWTSHQFKTSSESFLRVKALFDNSDWLRRRVKSINESHGDEGIELLGKYGGCRLRFLARSKSSGRGFSPQRILFDEAQELARWAFQAMQPSLRAQPNPQIVYAGTVPSDQVSHPEHWTRLRDRGRAGTGRRLAWMEFTPEGSDDPRTAEKIDIYDRRHWRAATPGLGYRITEETIESDIEELGPEGAAIEVLSIWPTLDPDVDGHVIDIRAWAKGLRPKARPPEGPVVLGVDVNPERTRASIGVATEWKGKRTLLMVRTFSSVAAVVPALEKLIEKRDVHDVLLHPSSQAGALIPDLTAAGIEFTPVTATEMGQACARFISRTKRGKYVHVGQQELDDAVKGAVTRKTRGEVELWDRKDLETDISPVVAVSIADLGLSRIDAGGFGIH